MIENRVVYVCVYLFLIRRRRRREEEIKLCQLRCTLESKLIFAHVPERLQCIYTCVRMPVYAFFERTAIKRNKD